MGFVTIPAVRLGRVQTSHEPEMDPI